MGGKQRKTFGGGFCGIVTWAGGERWKRGKADNGEKRTREDRDFYDATLLRCDTFGGGF